MTRVRIALVAVGASIFSVFLVVGGTVQDQTNFLVDGGWTAATHRAECPVYFDDDCLDAGRQAGYTLHRYERLAFPVAVRVLADGGRDVQMPPMNVQAAAECIHVMAWEDCTLNAGQVGTVSGLLGQQLPFTPVGAVKQWGRAKFDAGLDCPLLDGGSFGDRNVMSRAQMLDPNRCELVGAGVVFAGSDPEVDL